jgi:toxin CcdB
MPQYAVFPNPGGDGYLLDVQSNLLGNLNVRTVVPLLPQGKAPTAATRLNPVFQIDGAAHVMLTQYIAAVPLGILKSPTADLSARSDVITAALDMLLHGI